MLIIFVPKFLNKKRSDNNEIPLNYTMDVFIDITVSDIDEHVYTGYIKIRTKEHDYFFTDYTLWDDCRVELVKGQHRNAGSFEEVINGLYAGFTNDLVELIKTRFPSEKTNNIDTIVIE